MESSISEFLMGRLACELLPIIIITIIIIILVNVTMVIITIRQSEANMHLKTFCRGTQCPPAMVLLGGFSRSQRWR